MKYRIKFRKYSSMIFIGHLDIMRFFQKAMRRADIPIAYSTGYSPHQIMSFAAPLGVGLYSNGEYLDIEVTHSIKTEEMKNKLNAVMVEGIEIVSVKVLPQNAGNAMASVAAASYTIALRPGHIPSFSFGEKWDLFIGQNQILFEKQTKKNTIELNLKDGIYGYQIKEQEIYLMLDASSSGNIKPSMVIEAYYQFMHTNTQKFDFVITREETYTKNEADEFIPLEAVGYDQ